MIDDNEIQNIIKAYFKQKDILVNHQIDSYDDLIDNIFPKILSQYFPLTVKINNDKIKYIEISVLKININKPYYTENNGCTKKMTPNIARLRNFTYSCKNHLVCDNFIKLNKFL